MFWEIFSKLCLQRGKSPNAVAKELKISSGSVTNWKNGTIPNNSALLKLADYFNVTVDYLLGKEDTIPADTTDFAVEDMLNLRRVPIYETVSAGLGATADDRPTEYIPLCFDSAYEADNTICIRVKGDSMAPIINNGDIVHVLKQDVVERGMMAVVLVDDEGFVKYLDYGTGWIELVSQNQMYRTMRFEGADTERVRVIGVVTGVTRRGTLHMNK
jgi:repressor LexA